MSDNSKIEWTDATWNPLLGCTKVSPGCDNCYAITNARIRESNPNPKISTAYAGLVEPTDHGIEWTGRVNLLDDRLDQPLHWKRPRRIFVNAQSDLFHESVPDRFIATVFGVMAAATHHTFQLLTKRHGRMRSLLSSEAFQEQVFLSSNLPMPDIVGDGDGWPLRNVWLGVSVENQQWADIRIPALLQTPAAVRWLSCEPLLGPVELDPDWLGSKAIACWAPGHQPTTEDYAALNQIIRAATRHHAKQTGEPAPAYIDWVVAGGESGHQARAMHPAWARRLRDDCSNYGIPFLLKQWGEWAPPATEPSDAEAERLRAICVQMDGQITPWDQEPLLTRAATMVHLGKKAAGRELDGRTWDQYPTAVVPA